jgi:hypothetical protein
MMTLRRSATSSLIVSLAGLVCAIAFAPRALAAAASARPTIPSEKAPAYGTPCTADQFGERALIAPYPKCDGKIVKGKIVYTWSKVDPIPPPKSLKGLARCMYGTWKLTGEAFTEYWTEAVGTLDASAGGDGSKPTGEYPWVGEQRYFFGAGAMSITGQIFGDQIVKKDNGTYTVKFINASQITITGFDGYSSLGSTIDPAATTVTDVADIEPVNMEVACSPKKLTLTVVGMPTPVRLKLVRF